MRRGSEIGRWRTVLAHLLRCGVACIVTVAGMTVVALATVDAPGESPASAAGPAGSWQVDQAYTPTSGALAAISCGSATDCIAVGSDEVVATTNGGSSWTTENGPTGMGTINAISCSSATTCMIVGYTAENTPAVAVTTNGGTTWTYRDPSGLDYSPLGVSCPSTTTCSVVGGSDDVITTTNGGASWTAEQLPTDSEALDAIACPSTTTCVAVGNAPPTAGSCSPSAQPCGSVSFEASTTDAGATWTGVLGATESFGFAGDSFSGVSCPSTSECMAVGSDGTNTDPYLEGETEGILLSGTCTLVTGCGTVLYPESTSYLGSVSCFSSSACIAVGSNGAGGAAIATASATGWTTMTATIASADAVSCQSSSDCMVAGGVTATGQPGTVLATTDGGASWATSFTFPYTVSSLTSVSCFSASVCMAAGGLTDATSAVGPTGPGVVVRSSDGGATWATESLPAGVGALSAISCASTSVCEAFGNPLMPVIVGTTDGGATWHSQTVPSGVEFVTQLSCPSISDCTGVGEAPLGSSTGPVVILNTTDGGATWTTETAPSGLSNLTSIACPSVSECTAVGETNVSAPTPNTAIITTTDGGSTWTSETAPSGVSGLVSIACPTVSVCMAIGSVSSGATVISTTDAGTTWTTESFPSSTASPGDIACASATACTVVGETSANSGHGVAVATTDGGSTWTIEKTPTASDYAAISCPAAGACTAVGQPSASGGAVIIGQAPITSMLIPSNGATVSGSQLLDASASSPEGMGSVKFEVSGGSRSDQVVASGTATLWGWLGSWNTTTVANGAYSIQSVATDADGDTVISAPRTVTVDNSPPTSGVLVPASGVNVSGGSSVLDASAAANVSSVTFELSGGSLSDKVIASGTPTYVGWLAKWNTTTVPNGIYNLQTVAAYPGGVSGPSAPVSITVGNPPPSSTVLVPAGGASVSGTSSVLDAAASANVSSVTYELSGGTLSDRIVGTGTPTYVGWLAEWNTTSVLDGSYSLVSVAAYPDGVSTTSSPISITVDN